MLETARDNQSVSFAVEGVAKTPAIILLNADNAPTVITLDGAAVSDFEFSKNNKLLWIRFENEARPRTLTVSF